MKRVQKYIETLDMVKLQNAKSSTVEGRTRDRRQENSVNKKLKPVHKTVQQPLNQGNYTAQKPVFQRPLKHSENVVVTTKWETFD